MTTKVCPCGQKFTPTHGNQKYCPSCREARFNAANPLQICSKCGKETRVLFPRTKFCRECFLEETASRKESQRPKQDSETSNSDTSDEELKRWLDDRLSREDDEPYGGRYGYGVKLPRHRRTPDDSPVNPEEVPHPDQKAIDAAFRALMRCVDRSWSNHKQPRMHR